MEPVISLLLGLCNVLARGAEEFSSWSGDRWVAVAAMTVAALAALGTFWQAAEARGAKNLARQALGEARRSADAASAAVVAAQNSAAQAQRVADIEAGRDHAERRRAIVGRFEIRNGQRLASLKNMGQQSFRVKAMAIRAGGGSSLQADNVELRPSAARVRRLRCDLDPCRRNLKDSTFLPMANVHAQKRILRTHIGSSR
ncbi:hypothetical protein QLQ12_44285 [Actinoplanes sp. NEAU-A12]|uniref:Uncharacterized protein n=1 Tax=Actinoplanes sandaracinus TaxID=3045177 RepID=A0ABT6X0Z2_9ACTN|nr:hypothetical protein [Actinoplanes sandaracinus]MDI6105622.1 hypothetical protein [Actinoplanes sandaracinus]